MSAERLGWGSVGGDQTGGSVNFMATAKPSRTRRQPSPKTPSTAQIRQQRKQQSLEITQKMADAAYAKAYRHTRVAIAREQAQKQALADAGIKPQQQQPQAKPPKSGRKPPRRR